MITIEEYRRGGGHVARVPNSDVSHIQTRPKAIKQPDGSVYHGPETLMTEVVLENGNPTRVVRFSNLNDFDHFKRGRLEWERINPELCAAVSNTLRVDNGHRGSSPV